MMNIVALCMTSIMIYHVKTKYTAVGKLKKKKKDPTSIAMFKHS